mmetsp:Transcript_15697/g.18117  ORF Transcript_15697/g.18117 Transcript_15697/m.18117 type:complete len:142 (+) Transcript_15697:251-676(+)
MIQYRHLFLLRRFLINQGCREIKYTHCLESRNIEKVENEIKPAHRNSSCRIHFDDDVFIPSSLFTASARFLTFIFRMNFFLLSIAGMFSSSSDNTRSLRLSVRISKSTQPIPTTAAFSSSKNFSSILDIRRHIFPLSKLQS